MTAQLAAELAGLAAYIDGALDDEHADRQMLAEVAVRKIRDISRRLAAQGSLPRIDGSIPATGVSPDGNAQLVLADLVLVLDALHLAASVTDSGELATQWRALAFRLNDDR